ncbi:UNVERIFIED_ORG: hypothetical protein M2348_001086 [Sphingomonas sp. R1F5B]
MIKEFAAKAAALQPTITGVLDGDKLILSYSQGTVEELAEMVAISTLSPINAARLGQWRAQQDVLAFLRSRQRAADTVARNNPAECERAKIIAQQIGVEIEAIEQGLHEGCAGKEAALGDVLPAGTTDTELERLRAENAHLRKWTRPEWFYLGDDTDSERCRFSLEDALDDVDVTPGNADIFEISTATSLPSIWAVVYRRTDEEIDASADGEELKIHTFSSPDEAQTQLLAIREGR